MSQYITAAREGQPLKDVSSTGRVRPWKQHKAEARTLASVYELLADKDPTNAARWLDKSRRVADCTPWMEYELHQDPATGEYMTLHQASFCRVRLCPMCQWRRSLKLGAQARAVVAEADRAADAGLDPAEKRPRPRYLLLTLTVKNVPGDQLGATIDLLHGALSKLTRRKVWAPIRGWLRATEVTYNKKANTYHPHLHILLMVSPSYFGGKGGYVSQKAWRAAWASVLGVDYDPQVDVRAVKDLNGKPLEDLPPELAAEALGKAVAEVAKYAAKPADYLDPSDLDASAEVLRVMDLMLHKRRMTAWGGELKEIAKRLQLDDVETGDLIHVDDQGSEPGSGVFLTYVWRKGYSDYYPKTTALVADRDPAHKILEYRYRIVCDGIRERIKVYTSPLVEVPADPVRMDDPGAMQAERHRKLRRAEVEAVAAYRSRQEHEEMEYDQAMKLARRMGRHYHLGPIHNRED